MFWVFYIVSQIDCQCINKTAISPKLPVAMFVPLLLSLLGLVMAQTDPLDFSVLCSSSSPAECPAGWSSVQGDCFKFAGWEQVRAAEVFREDGAEYS